MRYFVLSCSLIVVALAALGCSHSEAQPGGGDLFQASCARCHGVEGTGGIPGADGSPAPRNFHDTLFQRTRTDGDIRNTIINGKGTAMPSFARVFDDAELTALVARIRGFDPAKEQQ